MSIPKHLTVIPNPTAAPIFGVVPNYAPPPAPHPEPAEGHPEPAPHPEPLDARIAHLAALRDECLTALRVGGFTPVSTFALRKLNIELDALRAESEAGIRPYHRQAIARLSETMLIGPAEVLAALDPALANLRYFRSRADAARRLAALEAHHV
ncbi:MAG: hypothetical protein HY834_10060 [Devosia nanyangense]|uniref:Uncharacterized protein n=1 Tax=Devosia nanyangense TaxID=1228055 RepID=A0A933L3D7_9HYPH|nr:hypothetical protein [Devosia nanyangense]